VVNGEGDRLPGIVVDRYGDVLVCQLLTAGAAALAPLLFDALRDRLAPATIYERSEGAVRLEEGLENASGVRAGAPPPVPIEIEEDGMRFLVDVTAGQKTGFFLDQREARARVRRLAEGRRVLNAFAYTGVAIAAGLAAREVVSIDTSGPLRSRSRRRRGSGTRPRRACALDRRERVRAPARRRRDLQSSSSPTRSRSCGGAPDVDAGLRAYKDVNLHALRRLEPGDCCSRARARSVSRDFRGAVPAAAADAGRSVRVVADGPIRRIIRWRSGIPRDATSRRCSSRSDDAPRGARRRGHASF
jgi:23S rRNA (cytosine1962-C5)-methyltransferase